MSKQRRRTSLQVEPVLIDDHCHGSCVINLDLELHILINLDIKQNSLNTILKRVFTCSLKVYKMQRM